MDGAIRLVDAAVPGVGPPLFALDAVRKLWANLKESKALCNSVQTRLDIVWSRLQGIEEEGALPQKFKLSDFTEIVARFHTLVAKQTEKNLIVRIGTAASFVSKLRGIHEDIDQLGELLRIDVAESLMQWRGEWKREVVVMTEQITQIADTGAAIRVDLGNVRESIEALTLLVHEKQKQTDFVHIQESLEAICYQLAREHKLALPTSVPPWFFTFDDIDFDGDAFGSAVTTSSMGTVHRGTWGLNTPVIVKRIVLSPKKASTVPTWKEADMWWNLNHPNVLRMYGACHVTEPAFIVSEEAKNGNIREYLAKDPRQARHLWRLLLEVAFALAYLREKHVVHGNLKVNNILIGDDGRAKVTDFGFSHIQLPKSASARAISGGAMYSSSGPAQTETTWMAPEVRAAVEKGEKLVPTHKTDIFAFGASILELLSANQPWGDEQILSKATLNPRRPRGVTDNAWELIKGMMHLDPSQRPTITQVVKRLERLAEDEATLEEFYSMSSSEGQPTSEQDVDAKREEYQLRLGVKTPTSRVPEQVHQHRQQQHMMQEQQQQLQRELEELRHKIREEERNLERILERQHQAEVKAQATPQTPREVRSNVVLSPNLSTKQLLRLIRWGTTNEQDLALQAIDSNQVDHSALEIVRNAGLEILVACVKHGHSPEFRQRAVDVLQSITTAGTGLYLDAILEHGVTQVLMGILHYRRIPNEQRRAGQFLVLLATRSARARSFFLQNAGVELLVKLLWHEHLPMFDKHFKARTDIAIIDDMRRLLATQAEARTKEGQRALENGNRDLAMQKLTEAIVLDPRNGRLYAKRSEVYAAFRKFEHAAQDAQQCIRFLPQYGEGYFRHAIALYGLKLPAQADKAVREGRKYDVHYFTRERLGELIHFAPHDDGRNNDKAWAVDVTSVEF